MFRDHFIMIMISDEMEEVSRGRGERNSNL